MPTVTKMKVDDSVLKQFVANLILTHDLKLKGWISDVLKSDVLEHKIYEFAVRQAMEYCYYEVVIWKVWDSNGDNLAKMKWISNW